jgi:hypothetical protein
VVIRLSSGVDGGPRRLQGHDDVAVRCERTRILRFGVVDRLLPERPSRLVDQV